jgi:lysophospholipase L1-like esterase
VAENARREEFNALMRQAYQGREPLFDLAAVESTAPDGAGAVVEWSGRSIPVLAEAYSEDGGHLNEAGRLRAARELVRVLARVASGPAPSSP